MPARRASCDPMAGGPSPLSTGSSERRARSGAAIGAKGVLSTRASPSRETRSRSRSGPAAPATAQRSRSRTVSISSGIAK